MLSTEVAPAMIYDDPFEASILLSKGTPLAL